MNKQEARPALRTWTGEISIFPGGNPFQRGDGEIAKDIAPQPTTGLTQVGWRCLRVWLGCSVADSVAFGGQSGHHMVGDAVDPVENDPLRKYRGSMDAVSLREEDAHS